VPNTRRAARSVELGSIAEINPALSMRTLSKNQEISLESVSEETGLIDPSKTQTLSIAPGSTFLVRDGDILLAKNSPHVERGKIAIFSGLGSGFGASPTSFHVIRPRRLLSSRWLWYFLRQRSVRDKAEQGLIVRGIRRELSDDFLKHLRIPLPPLTTQERIVRLLDEVGALRTLQKESILETEKIGAALFKEMFGDPDQHPKKWPRAPLSGLVRKVFPGVSYNTINRPITKEDWAVVTPGSVTSGFFKPEEALALTQKASTQPPISKGDLLMSWTNKGELVGTVALVEEDFNNLFLPNTLWKLAPRPSVSTSFLKELLFTPSVQQRIRDLAVGTVVSKITTSKLLALPVFKPRQHLQVQFDKIYWELPELRRSQKALSADLDHLHESLMKRVFPQTEIIAEVERPAMKTSKRVSRKKSSVKGSRKRVSAAPTSINGNRIIWEKLSPFQRDVWTVTQTFNRPFRVAELTLAVSQRIAKPVSREGILTSVELLVSLGVLIKEGRQDADRWRVPNVETDREIEV
jgi:type I restriction enzyme S subunit